MIRATIVRRTSDDVIVSFRIEGHAEYDEPGKDLVCAAVSAVTVGTVNAVEAVAGVILGSEMEEGLLDVTVPRDMNPRQAESVQLILQSMVVMLDTIAHSYGEYIQVISEGG